MTVQKFDGHHMMIYDASMRTIMDLPDQQVEALAMIWAWEPISRAEAIRQAVDQMLQGRPPHDPGVRFP